MKVETREHLPDAWTVTVDTLVKALKATLGVTLQGLSKQRVMCESETRIMLMYCAVCCNYTLKHLLQMQDVVEGQDIPYCCCCCTIGILW